MAMSDEEAEAIVMNGYIPHPIRMAVAKGRLDREDLRKIMEREPAFAADLCAELGCRSFGELREAGKHGRITATVVLAALDGSEVLARANRLREYDIAVARLRDAAMVPLEVAAKRLEAFGVALRRAWVDLPKR